MTNRFEGFEGYYNAETSKTNAFGDVGEKLFKQVMAEKGYTVIDRSKDLDYQLNDTDFEVIRKNGVKLTFEVKWDDRMAQTNNMFVETAKNGWLNVTKANCIAYGDANNEIFYLFYTNTLKKYIYEHSCSLRKITYPSLGRLVNINDFIAYCKNEDVTMFKIDIKNNIWER